MSAPPYMTVYIAEWTAGVQDLTCEQDGAYWRLVRAMWTAGGKLPNRADKLARICGLADDRWAEIGPDVLAFFVVRGGALTHKRIAKERRRYDAKIEQARAAAKASHSEKSKRNRNVASADAAIPHLRKACQLELEPDSKNSVPSEQRVLRGGAKPRLAADGGAAVAPDDEEIARIRCVRDEQSARLAKEQGLG